MMSCQHAKVIALASWGSGGAVRSPEQSLKPGSHITVMVPAAVSKAEYDYGTCVLSQVPQAEFNLVPGTAGTIQSGKRDLMSLC